MTDRLQAMKDATMDHPCQRQQMDEEECFVKTCKCMMNGGCKHPKYKDQDTSLDDAGLMFIEMGDSMTTVIKDGKLKSVIIENTFAGHSKAELLAIAKRMKG